jgi:hypothetical protein
MRAILALSLGLFLVLSTPGPVPADDQTELYAVIAKAIDAAGGKTKLEKFKAATWKGKGKFHGLGQAIDYTGEWAVQAPGKQRVVIEFEVNNMQFKHMRVVNGDMGWIRMMDNTTDMDKETLAEEKEQMYAGWVSRLTPLKDKGFQLSPLGEVKVGDRDAVGIKVAHKDHRDVNLFFDKQNGLLLKSETQRKDVQAGGRELLEEMLFGDYKEMDGMRRASKVTIKRDGKLYVEAEVFDFRQAEKLDDSVFAKP